MLLPFLFIASRAAYIHLILLYLSISQDRAVKRSSMPSFFSDFLPLLSIFAYINGETVAPLRNGRKAERSVMDLLIGQYI